MTIKSVVYSAECADSIWSEPLGCYTESYYMGEREYEVDGNYKHNGLVGKVFAIERHNDNSVTVYVRLENDKVVEGMWIPSHAVQRVYYYD